MPSSKWRPYFNHIYRDVLSQQNAARVEIFNANYGMSRGLAAAFLMLAAGFIIARPEHWAVISLLLFLAAWVFIYRMWRFGVHFAREVYYRFLLLPAAAGA